MFKRIFGKKRIYLDFASVTPLDIEVVKAMKPFLVDYIGNASSIYREGVDAAKTLEQAKKEIGEILGTPADTVVITSGGTESNNLVILGTYELAIKHGIAKPHFITTQIEHSSVLKVFKHLESKGAKVSYVAPNEFGVVDEKEIEKHLKNETVLVSVMYVNNEIGTIQPIKEISRAVRLFKLEKNKSKAQNQNKDQNTIENVNSNIDSPNFPYIHSDASQAVCDMHISALNLELDFLTIDGLKMYGPRGAGILIKRRSAKLEPIMFGGGQEYGFRPGTEHIANAVGLAAALKIAKKYLDEGFLQIKNKKLGDYLKQGLKTIFPNSTINGEGFGVDRIVNVCIPGIDAEYWVILLDKEGIACSFVSSCQNVNDDSSSYVLKAMNKKECALSSLRFSIGRNTTKSEIRILLSALYKLSTEYRL